MSDFPEEILWDSIVKNLMDEGLSPKDIAFETGFLEDQVWQMARDEYHPPYLSIIKLLDLHVETCPRKHHQIGIRSPEEATL